MNMTLDHSTMPDAQRSAILIIDDNPTNLGAIAGYLEEFGLEILVAQTGENGLEKAQFVHPDLILLDVVLPGIDGFETCRHLKENESTKNIPVIFMTVLTETEDKLKGFQAGAVDYITKPFQKEEVLARVTTHLRLRELTEQLEQNVQERTRELTLANQRLEQEIAERKQVEEWLREREYFISRIMDTAPNLVYIYDLQEHRNVYSNLGSVRLLGYSPEELQRFGSALFLKIMHPDDLERVAGYHERFEAAKEGQILEIEYRVKHANGEWRILHSWDTVFLQTPNGKAKQIAGAASDVTERRRVEEQLKNQNLLLEQAVQEKQREMEALFERVLRQEKLATIGRTASSIAHELRNPLGAVKNSVFFLKRLWQKQQLDASNPKVPEHLELIEAELDTSERVISDLLQLTRMNPIQRGQTDLRPIIEDAASRCQLPKQIRLTLDLNPEPFMIWADPSQLRQVFINLLTNAIQAIEGDGNITIRAIRLTKDTATRIEIENDGIGIEPDVLDKVFEPLYTTKATGTGLGLSICKQIIEHHQGQISIKSQVGQGTTVTIVLPKE